MADEKKKMEEDDILTLGDTIWDAENAADETSILGGQLGEAKSERDKYLNDYTSVLSDIRRQDEERLASVNPLTQDEIDRRRRAGTMVGSITSALANIANSILVGEGAKNATVPEGYTLSYQHWNDVEQRNRARQQEYDRIVESINRRRLEDAKAKYGAADERYKALEKQMFSLQQQKMKNEFAKNMAEYKAQVDKDKEEQRHENKIIEKQTPGAGKTGSSTGSSTGTKPSTNYRSFSSGRVKVNIPEGMSLSDAYTRLLTAATNKAESETNKKKKAGMLTATNVTVGGDDDTKGFDKVRNAVAVVGLTQEEVDAALGISKPKASQRSSSPTQGGGLKVDLSKIE